MIRDSGLVEIHRIAAELGADFERRAGVTEIDERLRSLRSRTYPHNVEISGQEAAAYLQECAAEIEAALRIHGGSYSWHKWLWFIRRIPDSVFTFAKFSNPEFDRAVAETAAGLFANSSCDIPDGYRIEETTVRRVLRFCGMALHLSDVQGALQWAGTSVRFNFGDRPIPDPIPQAHEDKAIALYVKRLDAELPMFVRLGIVTGLQSPAAGAPIIGVLFRRRAPETLNVSTVKFPFDAEVSANYRVSTNQEASGLKVARCVPSRSLRRFIPVPSRRASRLVLPRRCRRLTQPQQQTHGADAFSQVR